MTIRTTTKHAPELVFPLPKYTLDKVGGVYKIWNTVDHLYEPYEYHDKGKAIAKEKELNEEG